MIDLLTIKPQYYERDYVPYIKGSSVAADRITLKIPAIGVKLGSVIIPVTEREVLLSTDANWDDAQFATAANRAGKDFYIYVTATGIILSANSTVPTGYSASTATKIGGFHCLCLDVGTIASHALTGFLTGDILPKSVWDLNHRSAGLQAGMVYSEMRQKWVMIYLQSGTGASTASVFGATITDTRDWMDFSDDLSAVGCCFLTDADFSWMARNSNEKTNNAGSADPVTAGGHVDTAGRRMISEIGCEDMCGAMWQWLGEQSYRNDDASYSGSWAYQTLGGNKGSLQRQGASGDAKILAGGPWNLGTSAGSRCRSGIATRATTGGNIGARGCARHLSL